MSNILLARLKALSIQCHAPIASVKLATRVQEGFEDAITEIQRLQKLHLERTKSTHKALTERDEEIKRLSNTLAEIESDHK